MAADNPAHSTSPEDASDPIGHAHNILDSAISCIDKAARLPSERSKDDVDIKQAGNLFDALAKLTATLGPNAYLQQRMAIARTDYWLLRGMPRLALLSNADLLILAGQPNQPPDNVTLLSAIANYNNGQIKIFGGKYFAPADIAEDFRAALNSASFSISAQDERLARRASRLYAMASIRVAYDQARSNNPQEALETISRAASVAEDIIGNPQVQAILELAELELRLLTEEPIPPMFWSNSEGSKFFRRKDADTARAEAVDSIRINCERAMLNFVPLSPIIA